MLSDISLMSGRNRSDRALPCKIPAVRVLEVRPHLGRLNRRKSEWRSGEIRWEKGGSCVPIPKKSGIYPDEELKKSFAVLQYL